MAKARRPDVVELASRCDEPGGFVTILGYERHGAAEGEMLFTRPFPWESAMLHRIVFPEQWETSFSVEDEGDGAQTDWCYVRVVESSGELAWSSPIWVEKA